MSTQQIENVDYIVCQICHHRYKRLMSLHLAKHGLTHKMYRQLFLTAKLIAEKSSKATSAITSKKRKITHACPEEKRKRLQEANQQFWDSEVGKQKTKEILEKRNHNGWNNKRIVGIKKFQQSEAGKDWGKNISKGKLASGYRAPQNVKDAVRKAQTGRKHSPEEKERRAAKLRGKTRSKKATAQQIVTWRNTVGNNPKYWEKMQRALKLRPNKFEQKIAVLLPPEFQYTGDFNPSGMFKFQDGRNKNADFTFFPSRTAVLECFGTYWHGKHFEDLEPAAHEADIVNNYSVIGVACLVIWEYELKDMTLLKNKISQFVNYVSKENVTCLT